MGSFKTVATDLLSWLPDPYESSNSSRRSRSRTKAAPTTSTTRNSLGAPKASVARERPRTRSQPPPSASRTVTSSKPHAPARLKKQPLQQHLPRARPVQPQPSTLDDLSYFYRAAKKRLLYNMREVDPLVVQYTHMQEMPDADQALLHLRKIASCVKPIMRKRGWRVHTLSEFYPDQRNLLGLNVNRGQSILVRLRHPNDKARFLPFESTLDTMLHELCHIVHGPHDGAFNALWQELRDEWEVLTLKGYTGEGFLSRGQKVGGALIPRDEMRRRARAEANKRDQRRQQERVKQGHRLGGSRPVPGFEAKDAAAEATLRRISATTTAVTEGCGTGTKMATQAAADAQLNGFRTKEEMDQANEIAIQQAAIELMAQEEERALEQQHRTKLVAPPISDGLVWDAINGLQPAQSTRSVPVGDSKLLPAPPHVPVHSKPSSKAPLTARATSYPGRKAYEVHHTGRPMSRLVAESEEKQRQKNLLKQGSYWSGVGSPSPQASSSTARASSSASASRVPSSSSSSSTWQCTVCTLINASAVPRCGACDNHRPITVSAATAAANGAVPVTLLQQQHQRPVSVPALPTARALPSSNFKYMEWCCMWCGNWMEQQWWTCDVCGHMKDQS